MKIKFGAIVTDGRGKIGGHVASKNRSGAYLRTKVTPSNPNTSSQAGARGLLASLSQQWGAQLTDANRLAWNNAVKDYATTDIFGDIKNPTGLNLFIKLNTNSANVGGAYYESPPPKENMPSFVVTTGTYDISTGVLTLNIDGSDANGTEALVRATPAMSHGISFVKTQLRVIGVATVTTGAVVLTGDYATKFGTISAGNNVYASVQLVLGSGQKSVEQQVKVTVTA